MNRRKIAVVFMMSMALMGSCLNVSAEEIKPAGYHVYEIQDDQVSDTWYGIARGDYLQGAIAKLTKGSAAKYAICSGTTLAHRPCDRVYTRIYLDQSDNGSSGWWTVNYWTAITYDNSTSNAKSGEYEITRDQYYSVQGVHSVTEGDIVETTTTCTNALYFD